MKGEHIDMQIILCITISTIVSAIVSILMLKFFAYKYFKVIDKYVSDIMKESQKSIRDTISVLRNATGSK